MRADDYIPSISRVRGQMIGGHIYTAPAGYAFCNRRAV